jgi:hypothetical protein
MHNLRTVPFFLFLAGPIRDMIDLLSIRSFVKKGGEGVRVRSGCHGFGWGIHDHIAHQLSLYFSDDCLIIDKAIVMIFETCWPPYA